MRPITSKSMEVISLDDVAITIDCVCEDIGYGYSTPSIFESFIWAQFTGEGVLVLQDLIDAMMQITEKAQFAPQEVEATQMVIKELKNKYANNMHGVLVIRNW